MPLTTPRPPARRGRGASAAAGWLPALWLLAPLATAHAQATGGAAPADPPPAARRAVPEALNFANGLFRERRYELAAQEYERFLRDAKAGPDADDARFGLANARLFQGEYAKARTRFEEFLDHAPEHANAPTAWYRVGETAYMLGDLTASRRAFETYTKEYPGHKHLDTAWPYLGDVCLRLNDPAAARQAYETSLEKHPDGRLADRARFGLGRALTLQGESGPALKAFATLAEKGGKDWVDRAWFQIGQLQAQGGHSAEAAEAFGKVESTTPKSPLVPEARLNRAEALVQLGKREEAEPVLKGLAADAPRNLAARAAFTLGAATLDGGDAAGAEAILTDAASRFAATPMAAAINFRAAEAAVKLGKPAEARARFLKAAEADPNDPWADDALLRAARLALDQRDLPEAARLADAFASKFPKSPLRADARLVAARAALAGGQAKQAITMLTSSLADDQPGAQTAEAQRYYLGLAYREDGQAGKAAEVLDALARTPAAPIAADAQFMVGQGHIEAKRYNEAASALEKYLAGKPDGEVADYALAHLVQARLELGDADAARKALATLASKFPKSKVLGPSRVRVAEAALAAKKYDEAAEAFEKAATDPATDPALAARARLGLGWARLDGGHPDEAASAFAAYLDAAKPDDPLAPEAALARGRALEAAKQTEPALAAYEQASTKFPATDSATLAALARARLLVDAKRPSDAAAAFGAFVKDHPDYKPKDPATPGLDAVLADWGWSLIDSDKPAEADAVFARLLKDYPDSPHAADARFNLAESANLGKKYDDVIALLIPLTAEGTKASPRLVRSALFRLGRTQAEKKDWAAAAKSLDRMLTEFPDGPFRREARLLRAEVALEAGDAAKADELLAALASEPAEKDDPPGFDRAVRRRRVQTLLALKKWPDVVTAAEAFAKDASDDPLRVEVDYARGRALQQLARFDDARAAYRSVIEARKGGDLVARAQLMIGETYFHQKEYHEAVREFLKVDILYDAPPWQAAALLEAGKAHEQLAQWADAAETYKRLRDKFPAEPAAAEAKTRLDAVRPHLDGAGAAPVAPAGGEPPPA